MKIQLLPSSFDENGRAAARQHLPCFLIDDCAAIDAGSLALAVSDEQRQTVRDIVLTHAHLDHIATLPSFIDDLFEDLRQPVCVHALSETIETLETHIFNWQVFPRFSELCNDFGAVLQYKPFVPHKPFPVKHLEFAAVPVNHQVATVGFVVSDKRKTVAFTSDTAESDDFWTTINALPALDALFVECAFPDSKAELARVSHHLTPRVLRAELGKLKHRCPIFAINLKPAYYNEIAREILALNLPELAILPVGRDIEI